MPYGALSVGRRLRSIENRAVRSYSQTVGNGVASVFTITPDSSLGIDTTKCDVQVLLTSTKQPARAAKITYGVTGGTQITLDFGTNVPTSGQYTVIIQGSDG